MDAVVPMTVREHIFPTPICTAYYMRVRNFSSWGCIHPREVRAQPRGPLLKLLSTEHQTRVYCTIYVPHYRYKPAVTRILRPFAARIYFDGQTSAYVVPLAHDNIIYHICLCVSYHNIWAYCILYVSMYVNMWCSRRFVGIELELENLKQHAEV